MNNDTKSLISNNHLTPPHIKVNTENTKINFNETEEISKHEKCILDIQNIFNKGYTPANGNQLINYIQKQRTLLIEIMLNNFMKRPNPKMADSMNTLLAQMEKSVRDDRKEAVKAKEMETSKETFELFSKSLNAVIDGRIHIPTFGKQSLILDPLKPLLPPEQTKFKPGEFVVGRQEIDLKPIEAKMQETKEANQGSGELTPIKVNS